MYPNNNNNNNNNKKDKNPKRGIDGTDGESVEREEELFLNFFLLFVSFSNLRKSDRRFLSEQKAKLDNATRATRRYQYLSVSSNFKR